MDPNAKPATICKNKHKRIWHTAEKCPLCVAVEYGRMAAIQRDRAISENSNLKAVIRRMKEALP